MSVTETTAAAPGAQPVAAQPAPARRPSTRTRRGIHWEIPGRFGPVTGPVAAVLGVLAVGAVGDLAHLAPALGIVAGGLLGLFDWLHAVAHKHTPVSMAARWAAFVAAGGWLFAAWTVSPWSPWTLVPLGIAGAGLARVAFVFKRRRTEEELRRLRDAAAAAVHALDARAKEWEDRIVRVSGGKQWEGVRIANIADWDNGDGFTLDGDCPPGGTGWRDLAAMTTALAADARLLPGCEIEVRQGIHQGAFLMTVPIRDTFAQYQLTDDPIVPATVLNGVDLGVTRTRERAVIPIRETSTAVVSDTGGGKTTLLHRMVMKIAMCTDGLTPIIDMNNGAMGVAWCDAWWDGEAPYPVVPAIAGDAEEAFLLTRFFVGVALGRKKRSGPLKMLADTSLMPIGNGAEGQPPPGIFPIYDESAELVGADASADDVSGLSEEQQRELIKKTMAAAEKTLRVARDAGIRPIFSAIRATDDFLPTSLLALCRNRVGLHLPTDADHGVLFGWSKGDKSEANEPRKGVGRYSFGINLPTTMFAAPDMTPRQIREYSIRIAEAGIGPYDLTPEDIADGEAYAGEGVWTRRWERAEKLFGRPRREYQTKEVVMASSTPEQDGEQPKVQPARPPVSGGFGEVFAELDRIQADLDAVLADDDDAPALEQTDVAADDEAAEIARLTAAWELPAFDPTQVAVDEPAEPLASTWQERVLQLLDKAGPAGAAPGAIADRIYDERRWGTTRQTVNAWLSAEAQREGSVVVRVSRGRYVHRKHLGDAT